MSTKTILLLAGSLMAVPVFAQSNVAIYGRFDYGLMSRGGNSGGVSGVNGKTEFASGINGPSRLGFRGGEDLGNGLKAIFELEFGVRIDEGSTTSTQLGNRHSWVGLRSDFGTLIGGRIDGLRYSTFGKYDPFHGLTLANFGQMAPMVDRYDNSLMYTSPSVHGVTARLAYSGQVKGTEGAAAGTHGGNDGDNRMIAAALSYNEGPLSLGAAYESYRTKGVSHGRFHYATLGGSYDFRVIKLSALFDKLNADTGNTLVSGQKQTNWMIGLTAPVTANLDVRAMYGSARYDRFAGIKANKLDASKLGVGAIYKLSKRTSFYADYGSIQNDANATNTIGQLSTFYKRGYGTRGFDLGIAHKF